MSFFDRMSEKVARQMSRRKFLDKTAAAICGIVAAGAAELTLVPDALADYCQFRSNFCTCNPPGGTYCNSSYCNGASCQSPCSTYTGFYPTGCWCTQVCYI